MAAAGGYDPTGTLSQEQLILGGTTSYTVGYDYDAADRLTEIVYPDGSKVNRSYTDRHELHEVFYTPNGGAISDVIERGYDNAGRLTSTAYGNNLTETRTYRTNGVTRAYNGPGAHNARPRTTAEDAGKSVVTPFSVVVHVSAE